MLPQSDRSTIKLKPTPRVPNAVLGDESRAGGFQHHVSCETLAWLLLPFRVIDIGRP